MSKIFDDLLKVADNSYATKIGTEGIPTGDVAGFVSTGSYSLNALLSGSIYGGFPSNKVIALAGEPATGKTWFAINILKKFLDDNPEGRVFYFETEAAVSTQMFKDRGCDLERIASMPVQTIEEFRTQAMRILDKYLTLDEESRAKHPIMFILDSLGNISTNKEMEDMADGKATRDMTRSQLIKGAFRALTLKMGRAQVPIIVTNHVYDVIGSYVPVKKMGGGSGLDYAASTIVFLSKSKAYEGSGENKERIGVQITATLKKSRFTIEEKQVKTLLNYRTGLDMYYGLLPLAEKFGIVKKVSTKYEFPDGTKAFESAIVKNPEKYFTPEILKEIDAKCADEFLYGKTNYCVMDGGKTDDE